MAAPTPVMAAPTARKSRDIDWNFDWASPSTDENSSRALIRISTVLAIHQFAEYADKDSGGRVFLLRDRDLHVGGHLLRGRLALLLGLPQCVEGDAELSGPELEDPVREDAVPPGDSIDDSDPFTFFA